MYTHSAQATARHLRSAVTQINSSCNLGFCDRTEDDELVPVIDLNFRRFIAKSASCVRVCDRSKYSKEASSTFLSWNQSIVELQSDRDDERRVRACEFTPIFVYVDQFATCATIGYYLGRKSK